MFYAIILSAHEFFKMFEKKRIVSNSCNKYSLQKNLNFKLVKEYSKTCNLEVFDTQSRA